ncbi:MAG: ABC transporter substrate-binding protein, partial [Enterococcus sp.]|nr:ABC transporter substrate-binding protein [Enterococcus sp.]
MKNKKMMSVLLLSAVILGACGKGSTDGSAAENGGSEAAVSTKDTISWMAMLHTAAPPSGEIENKLEEYTGVKVDFSWVPDASKSERINAALASNSLTDIVTLADIKNTTVRSSLASGMFWDVE